MSPEIVQSPARELVTGGRIRVEVHRDPCPPDARPCGSDCPFTERASLGVKEIRPHAAPLRQLAELIYLDGLRTGTLDHEAGGSTAEMVIELEGRVRSDPADTRPVHALRVSIANRSTTVPVEMMAAPFILESRRTDATRTGRVAPHYEAQVSWQPEDKLASGRLRPARPPVIKVGRRVLDGVFPDHLREIPLDQPATSSTSNVEAPSPMVKVVWRDAEGLEHAREMAAEESGREIAFLLVGAMKFSRESRTAFTEVHRVAAVNQYDVSNEFLAAISPESYAEVKAIAAREGLDIVGILHSHVLEMIKDDESSLGDEKTAVHQEERQREKASGLFFSGTDVQDHAFFLPSAWSIGGVLNVRQDGHVQLGVFGRDTNGSFVPARTMYVPNH